MTIYLLNSDARNIPLSDQSVQCIITSPPYYGLRDYGTAQWNGGDPMCDHSPAATPQRRGIASSTLGGGKETTGHQREGYRITCARCGAIRIDKQIGLERTPQEYVVSIVAVMRECWRVLKDDGVLFLNLGDSYMSSGPRQTGRNDTNRETPGGRGGSFRGGERRAIAYGTSGKELEDYQDRDCLCGNLCDVCRVVYQNHKSRNDDLLVSMLVASLSETSRERKVSQNGHLPTSDSLIQDVHSASAILDFEQTSIHESERLRAVLASMIGESYPLLLDVCLQRANHDECLLCARSLVDYAQGYVDKTRACTCDTVKQVHPSGLNMLGKSSSYVAYPHYTTESLKPKDLIGIPWRCAFALQDDGWYLRSDIIWSKPNPMPESVTDRPTKAHEYIFLLTKRARYYYDAKAIQEESIYPDDNRKSRSDMDDKRMPTDVIAGIRPGSAIYPTRNRRSVWTVATTPYSGAHFATFPPKLIEPMILAGSRPGDLILDPFAGTATVGRVAIKHQRRFVGLDLNLKYIGDLAKYRTSRVQVSMRFETES